MGYCRCHIRNSLANGVTLHMSIEHLLNKDIDLALGAKWNTRAGRVIPMAKSVPLLGGGVTITAAMLYADLAGSTDLVMSCDRRVVAKLYKAFLACCSRLIRAEGGHVRSFDGDRVMGVFRGNSQCTAAARCALKINYAFVNLIRPRFIARYGSVETDGCSLGHCVGLDTSEVLSVKAGVRDNNDLVWVGRAPNVAAKLSDLRQSPYHTFATADVFDQLPYELAYGGELQELMWQPFSWDGIAGIGTIYGSAYCIRP